MSTAIRLLLSCSPRSSILTELRLNSWSFRVVQGRICRYSSLRRYSSADGLTHSSTGGHLVIAKSCMQRLKAITDKNEFLRVVVEGGGCSGFQYKFEFDTDIDQENDRVFEENGVRVVADKESLKMLDGATVEFETDLIRSGFRVANIPKAEKGCSCGVSFSVKL